MVLVNLSVLLFFYGFFRTPNQREIFPSLGLSDTIISMVAADALFRDSLYTLKKGDFIIGWNDTEKFGLGNPNIIWRRTGLGQKVNVYQRHK